MYLNQVMRKIQSVALVLPFKAARTSDGIQQVRRSRDQFALETRFVGVQPAGQR